MFGRKKQLDALNDFLKPKQTLFSIMAIVAPSGAGKTRLVTEWFVENFINNADAPQWQAGFIDSSDITPWQEWMPTCNTLIIADYIYRYDAVINEIIKKGEQSKQHHIRLLVLDQVLDSKLSNLIDDPHGRRAHGPDMAQLKNRERFVHSSLYLEKVDNRMDILQDIIAYVSGKDKDSEVVRKILALIQTIDEIDNAPNKQDITYPLFAALIGQALKSSTQSIFYWKRKELIDYYLHTSNRLPWAEQKYGQKVNDDGGWVGAFVAAATIRRGMSFDALRSCLPDDKEYTYEEFNRIKSWCWRIVSSVNDKWLKPFVPNILGENFFLLFFQNFKEKSSVRDAFIRMLCSEENNQVNENIPSGDLVKKYMDFVQHLARNLANEEQDNPHVKTAWQTLAAFLNSALYPETSRLSLTVSFVIMAVSDILEEKDLSYLNVLFLPQVNTDDFVVFSEGTSYEYYQAVDAFTKYFDRCDKAQRSQPTLQNQLNTIYLKLEEEFLHRSYRLIRASHLGCLNTVKFFISQHNTNINATDHQGNTALMSASKKGHEAVVELLLKEGAKEKINESDEHGMTALMFASLVDSVSVVELLLKEGAKEEINESDEHGMTALMLTSDKAVASLLIKARAIQ